MASSSRTPGSLLLWLVLALVVIVLDQFTKTLILGYLDLHDIRRVTSYFDIVRAHNTGAAFSLLASGDGWQRWFFTAVGFIASGVMVWMLSSHRSQKLFSFAIAMILGGAVGNVVDRLMRGHVIDFLQFHFAFLEPVFRGGYFPSFNVADSAITLGAACLVLDEIRRVRRSK